MNEREELLARIKTAEKGMNSAQTDAEKILWVKLYNKHILQLNRLKQRV